MVTARAGQRTHPIDVLNDMTLRAEVGDRVVAEMYLENDRTPVTTVGSQIIKRNAEIATDDLEMHAYLRNRKRASLR